MRFFVNFCNSLKGHHGNENSEHTEYNDRKYHDHHSGSHDYQNRPYGTLKERHTRTLFVRNIPYECSEGDLVHLFSKYGEIKRRFILIDRKGMAFFTYVSILQYKIENNNKLYP